MKFFKDLSKAWFGSENEPKTEIIGGIPQGEMPIITPQKNQIAPTKGEIQKDPIEEESEETPPQVTKGRLPHTDKYWTTLKTAGRGKRTIQEYQYEYKWWISQAKRKGKMLYYLKIEDIESLLEPLQANTLRRKIAFLKGLGKWYLRAGKNKLHIELSKFVNPKIHKRLPADLGEEKFEELQLKAIELCKKKERVGIWLGLMLTCGLRISEIKTVKVLGNSITVIGKGDKERKLPVLLWLLKALKSTKKSGAGGWAKSRTLIYTEIKKRFEIKPHSLRHTFASQLLRESVSIEQVKELLGHENVATTNIYAKIDINPDSVKCLDRSHKCESGSTEKIL